MADIITRFKLETTQYDSKLRDAAKGLQAFVHQAELGGKGFNNFSQRSIDAARSLGNVASGANNLKDKVKDLVGAYNDAAKAYNKLTQEQQQSDFGKALSQSLTQLQGRIKDAKQELNGITTELNGKAGGGFGGMMGKMSGMLGVSPVMLTGIGAATAAFAGLKAAIGDNISTAMGFEKSMSQLSSLTGMTGKDLDKLKEYAIDLGSTSTLTASQVADAFRLIGSQQPQLLSSGEALKEVTKYAITLSEAAGIDLQTAAQTLSTSINQMGGDSNNAARYVNVLAAASQKGAGDIAWLGEAITKSATAAKAVGTDYEELVANLEQLAKAGFDASTAGTALRSIIMNLEKQANQDFKPSIVGLTQAFENLGKANLDIVGYQQIAGKMFASQAMALANASQEAKKMTEAITGTNIAEAQAKTNTDNLDGALKSLASAWEGLNLHINSSNGLLKAFVDWCTNVIRDLDNMTTSAGRAKKALQKLNGGDNGQPSKVDRQINGLRGSNFKQQKYNSTLGQYNHDIKVAEYYKKKYKEAGWAGGSVLSDITRRFGVNMRGEEDIDNLINNLKTLREDYKRRAEKILNSTAEADNGKGKGGVVLDVDADTEEATKSIKDLQEEIKKLKKLRDDAANDGNTKLRDQYNTQIKSVQAQIKSMRGGSIDTKKDKDDFVEITGLIGNAQERVSDLQRQIRESWDQNEITTLNQKLKDAQNELDVLMGKLPKDAVVDITMDVDTAKALQKIGDIEGVTFDEKTMTVTANTQEALQKVQEMVADIDGKVVNMKVVPVITDDDIDKQLQRQYGKAIQVPITPKLTAGEELVRSIRIKLAKDNINADMQTLRTLIETSIKNGVEGVDIPADWLGEQIFGEGVNIPDEYWKNLQEQINEKLRDMGVDPIDIDFKTGKDKGKKDDKNDGKDTTVKALEKFNGNLSQVTGGIGNIANGIQQLGIELPQGIQEAVSVLTGISSIITGITSILGLILVAQQTTAAASWADAIIPFAGGGIVKAAMGTIVGNSYSGDNLRGISPDGQLYGLNAGEVVLNKSQVGNIASQLGSGGLGNLHLETYVDGRALRIVLNNESQGRLKGKYVTSNNVR